MRNDIHIVLDSIAVAEETPLRDDPRCHVVPLLVRHGDTEWVDGEKKLAGNVCHGGSKRAAA